MAAAKPGGFDKAAFIAAVRTAIEAAAPKNLDDADKFAGAMGVRLEAWISNGMPGRSSDPESTRGNSRPSVGACVPRSPNFDR